jgi:chromosomal replication initiation ATPase DnaA
VVDARHFAMYYRRKYQHMTTNQVGAMYNRDHATTIWAAGTNRRPGKVENMIQVDKLYRARAEQCLERLKKFHEK